MALSVTELDLLTFFEVEPRALKRNISWLYNDSVYEVTDGHCRLSFGVTPVSQDVSITLEVDGVLLYELHASWVYDVRYYKDKRGEILEILISQGDRLWLRIKPTVSISQWSKSLA